MTRWRPERRRGMTEAEWDLDVARKAVASQRAWDRLRKIRERMDAHKLAAGARSDVMPPEGEDENLPREWHGRRRGRDPAAGDIAYNGHDLVFHSSLSTIDHRWT